MKILELFAEILDYPSAQTNRRLGELLSALETAGPKGTLPPESLVRMKGLMEDFQDSCKNLDLTRLEEIYTDTFDLRVDCSLYAGYHLFGDDWRRSHCLVRLQERYRSRNFSAGTELPDHIGTMLRFLSCPGVLDDSGEIIEECLIPAVSQILDRINGLTNPYQSVIEALLICLKDRESCPAGSCEGES